MQKEMLTCELNLKTEKEELDNMEDEEEIIMEELEEGEVTSDSDHDYTPLQRPENYSNLKNDSRFPQNIEENDTDSDEQESTDVDSDSDSGMKPSNSKKLKIKLKPKPQKLLNRKKKYDIWSTRVQEDVLSETLNSCDVTKKDRSRNVESYDYKPSARYQSMISGQSNKRTREDRKNVHLRLAKRGNVFQDKPVKGTGRNILDLVTTLENSVEEIAKDISIKLYEEKEHLILKILNVVGKQKCFDIFKETKEVESNGGMLIMNQTRRRTPGGVFLYLLRCDDGITREQKDEMFSDERKISSKRLKDKRRKRLLKIRKQTEEERAKFLPELITKAEFLMESRIKKEVNEADVINPPPTPETDGLENSCDGIENLTNIAEKVEFPAGRAKVTTYDDDFLDIACSNTDMDIF